MGERTMRGTKLGTASLENDRGIRPAARHIVSYTCPNGHVFGVTLSVEAETPVVWECRCGSQGLLENASAPQERVVRPTRTHWDMLLERRTVVELQELLSERLELLRARKTGSRRSA